MNVVFFAPLIASVTLISLYIYGGDSRFLKTIGVLMVGLSIAFQFVPAMHVHFLIPLLLQVAVAIPGAIWYQLKW